MQKNLYDKLYLSGYRESLYGFEIARWKALEHLIGKVLGLNNIKKALDYGSGSGLHVDLWKKVFPLADLYFCDISSVALEKLVKRHPEFKLKCAEINENRALFDNEFFDVVVSIEVMEHVADLNNYLRDIYRLLKPEGIFIWTTPCANRFSIEHIYGKLTNRIEKTGEGYRRWKWDEKLLLRRLKSKEIKGKLQDIGFGYVGFRFRAHFFSFVCTHLFTGPLRKTGEKLMLLDYYLFRRIPNGASMIGYAIKRD